jgi:hypothetical protein
MTTSGPILAERFEEAPAILPDAPTDSEANQEATATRMPKTTPAAAPSAAASYLKVARFLTACRPPRRTEIAGTRRNRK